MCVLRTGNSSKAQNFISVTQRVQNFDTGNVVFEQIEGETEV